MGILLKYRKVHRQQQAIAFMLQEALPTDVVPVPDISQLVLEQSKIFG
ncbi:MAG: hypothetical protein RMX68_002010 [Aulosira sp. ZfuVER01]|nr:hypothetical protein [Aulosira sp. ZfuVER01]MDZ7996473.1 hypothetical protein [Aulosira sp. DedVER01a]MDZ8056189.1 hypothetical protein [Aulosira sp. ZfuCHP01]